MKTATWNRFISGHSPTLANHLRVAIYDYQRRFDHEPKLIVIPYFRRDEMPDVATFHGIPWRFSIISDAIELHGK